MKPAKTKETPSQKADRIYAEQHPEKPTPSPAERCDVRVKIDGGWPSCTLPAGRPLPHSVPGPQPEAASEVPDERMDMGEGRLMEPVEFERLARLAVTVSGRCPSCTTLDGKIVREARLARGMVREYAGLNIPELVWAEIAVLRAALKTAEEERGCPHCKCLCVACGPCGEEQKP